MRAVYVVALLGLAGCGMGGQGFMGAQPTSVSVGGMAFDVRLRDDMAEAQRRNFILRARFADIAPNAGLAIEQVSGCRVRPGTLRGDPSVITAALDCP